MDSSKRDFFSSTGLFAMPMRWHFNFLHCFHFECNLERQKGERVSGRITFMRRTTTKWNVFYVHIFHRIRNENVFFSRSLPYRWHGQFWNQRHFRAILFYDFFFILVCEFVRRLMLVTVPNTRCTFLHFLFPKRLFLLFSRLLIQINWKTYVNFLEMKWKFIIAFLARKPIWMKSVDFREVFSSFQSQWFFICARTSFNEYYVWKWRLLNRQQTKFTFGIVDFAIASSAIKYEVSLLWNIFQTHDAFSDSAYMVPEYTKWSH